MDKEENNKDIVDDGESMYALTSEARVSMNNADIIVCIGDGTKGSGCGEAGGRSGDACSRCGGMLLSKIALKAADELAAMRKGEQ